MSHPDPTTSYEEEIRSRHPSIKPSAIFKSKRRHGLKMIEKKWAARKIKGPNLSKVLDKAK